METQGQGGIPQVRTGQGQQSLDRAEFGRRMKARFQDPLFQSAQQEIDRLIDVAWEAYEHSRRSPRTRKAGPEFHDPDYELAIEWLETREQIRRAERRQKDPGSPSRILLICAAARNDQTCPGEMSKSWRLLQLAREEVERAEGFECDVLDLSELTAQYGRQIFPCKACVSTAMPLCNWPCSCYPNHALGQVNDWMNEIYPRWVAAHGVMILSPVYWHQAPSVLKLMMDRLVCADGGNPDPTLTQGKQPAAAKALGLQGWHYPRHLAGRLFAIVVHGDTVGAGGVRQALRDWLQDMQLVEASAQAVFDRYIGYYEPYASSHEALDRDLAIQAETRNAAKLLVEAVRDLRGGRALQHSAADPRRK